MKQLHLPTALLAAALAVPLVGCESTPTTVPTEPTDGIVGEGVDIQDYLSASQQLVESMLNSGTFDTGDETVYIGLSRVKDDSTARGVDTQILTGEIRSTLNKSKTPRIRVIPRDSDDPLTASQVADSEFAEGRQVRPDSVYNLSGRIADVVSGGSRDRQTTYVFTMRLTDGRMVEEWAEQKYISKRTR